MIFFRTPLHEACEEGNTTVAKILLENAQNNFGESACMKMVEDRDDDGATPLLLGVGKGGTDIVNLLLKFNANPHQKNKENLYPVHSAARTGDLDTLKLLCEVGAILKSRKKTIKFYQNNFFLILEWSLNQLLEFNAPNPVVFSS